jgi:ureidoglycolate lyase
MTVVIEAATSAAFKPFGALIEAPKLFGVRNGYTDWLGSARSDMTPRLHMNLVAPTSVPYAITLLERHPYSSQIFIPLDVERYLVAVAPSLQDGGPDQARLQVFAVPGNVGVVYRAGVWHAGATVLERPGSFAVLMWRNDTADDEEFLPLAVPIQIVV